MTNNRFGSTVCIQNFILIYMCVYKYILCTHTHARVHMHNGQKRKRTERKDEVLATKMMSVLGKC